MRVGSLFAGIGGFDLALERCDMEVVWQVEIDRHATRVLERHWPGVHRERDVRDCGASTLEPVDLITFGSPCTGLSAAGRRRGFADARSALFFEACRIIRELRPTFALWENVEGARSVNGGRDFSAAIAALAELGPRDLCWRVIDARYAGVPQRRRRIFALLDFGGERAGPVLFEPASLLRHCTPGRPEGPGLTGSLTGVSARGGWRAGADEATAGHVIAFHATQNPIVGAETPCLGANGSVAVFSSQEDTGEPWLAHTLTAAGCDASEDGSGRGIGSRVVPGLPAPTLNGAGKARLSLAATTRRLTPMECERLMGFPDGWTCTCGCAPYSTWKCRCPDGPRYRLLGNAVVVNVIYWIGRRLVASTQEAKQ